MNVLNGFLVPENLSKDTNIVNFCVTCEQLQVNDDVVAILVAILDFTIM